MKIKKLNENTNLTNAEKIKKVNDYYNNHQMSIPTHILHDIFNLNNFLTPYGFYVTNFTRNSEEIMNTASCYVRYIDLVWRWEGAPISGYTDLFEEWVEVVFDCYKHNWRILIDNPDATRIEFIENIANIDKVKELFANNPYLKYVFDDKICMLNPDDFKWI